ncbi:MAG: DUF167 domain-containing protein [Deltaproteobacteria bacterium]|jgi:uncharacterized protein (TIGR00251 family)|nr:DUF167 domain-containing protein [Deltaproteobacteria bacterium]
MAETRLKVMVTPRSSKNSLLGYNGDELKISLTAPPVEGAANEALVKFLARLLKIRPSSLKVTAGQASRHKTVLVEELEQDVAYELLKAHLPEKK